MRLADRGRGDHEAHQRDGLAGGEGSNEGVTGHKDEKALVLLRAMIGRGSEQANALVGWGIDGVDSGSSCG